jgi:uncharacterized membrane protein
MSKASKTLIVLKFDTDAEAESARQSFLLLRKEGRLEVEDTAVVKKDDDGKLHVNNQVARGTWTVAGAGGLLGLLLSGIFFPLAGFAIGMAGGALMAKAMNLGIDGKFVDQVAQEIQPGTSALFLLLDNVDPDAQAAALRQYQGKILHTNLPSDVEDGLRQAIGDLPQE